MIPVPPSGLSEATAEHAAATSRKSPRLINGYFIGSIDIIYTYINESMIPVPPSGLSEATAEHAAATSRKSPRLINGYFIESQTGYSHSQSQL